MRSKKLTRTPKARRNAMRHRLRGTPELSAAVCGKIAPEGSWLDAMVSSRAPWSTNSCDLATKNLGKEETMDQRTITGHRSQPAVHRLRGNLRRCRTRPYPTPETPPIQRPLRVCRYASKDEPRQNVRRLPPPADLGRSVPLSAP